MRKVDIKKNGMHVKVSNRRRWQNIASTIVFTTLIFFTIFIDVNKIHSGFFLFYRQCEANQEIDNKADIQPKLATRQQSNCLVLDPLSTVMRNVMTYLPLAYMIITKDYSLYRHYASATAIAASSVIILKKTISKTRPDGSNTESFPSGHAAMSFLGAAFVLYKYGLTASIPWMVVSTLNSASRVYCDRHSTIDVIAGAVLAVASMFYSARIFHYILVITEIALNRLKR